MRDKQHRTRLKGLCGIIIVVGALLTSGAFLLSRAKTSFAEELSWLAGSPVLTDDVEYRAEKNAFFEARQCVPQTIEFAGIITPQQRCITTGQNIFMDDRLEYIRVGSDRKYHRIDGAQISYGSTIRTQVPLTNTIVTRSGYTTFTYSATLTIEKDILQSLSAIGEPSGSLQYSYNPHPDFILSDSNGPIPVARAMAYSNNGRWLVVEMMDKGLARIDLQNNFKTELFSTLAPAYYTGLAPSMTLAISDDGSRVAVGGGNTPFLLYEINDSCTKIIYAAEPFNKNGYNECSNVGLAEASGLTGRYQYPYGLEFDNNYMLHFYAGYGPGSLCGELSSEARCEEWKTIQAAGYVPIESQLDYLALGDSYSSGEGDTARDKITNKKYYRSWTDMEEDKERNQPREKCHVSTRSYPYILSKGMSLGDPINNPTTRWQSVACSGAQIYDLNDEYGDNYKGQSKGSSKIWDNGKIPRLEGYIVEELKSTALNEFIPGRQKQIEFVKIYKPKVITLTIGGNDLGFGDKIKSCIAPGTCRIATEEGKAELAKQIRDTYDNLKSFYEKLYDESGRTAKIFVLGYPQFINENIGAACKLNKGALNDEERKVIGASIAYFNSVIKQAAAAAGVKYIDIEGSLQGGRLCDEGQAYMSGVSAIGSSEIQESFHPNAKGHYQIAMKLWDEVKNESLLDYNICPAVAENHCADPSATKDKITIPSYFQVTEPGYDIKYIGDMISGHAVKDTKVDAIRSSYSFEPRSTVEFTLFSDPIALGRFTASDDGSLSAGVRIPNSTPVGYHTLVAKGVTYSGEPVHYEQIILVRGSDVNDLDENGIRDNQQPCGAFMIASGMDVDLDGVDDACDPEISGDPELYRWRFGYGERTYNGIPEDKNLIYIERNIWAGSRTGVTDDYDADGDGWAVVGVSQSSQLDGVNMENMDTAIDFEVLGEGTSNKPHYPVLYIHPHSEQCRAFQPTSLASVKQNESRTLKVAEISNNKCPQELPGNDIPQESNPKFPKKEKIISQILVFVQEIKIRINNLIKTILQQSHVSFIPFRK